MFLSVLFGDFLVYSPLQWKELFNSPFPPDLLCNAGITTAGCFKNLYKLYSQSIKVREQCLWNSHP